MGPSCTALNRALGLLCAVLTTGTNGQLVRPRIRTESGETIITGQDIHMFSPQGLVKASELIGIRGDIDSGLAAVASNASTLVYNTEASLRAELTYAINNASTRLAQSIAENRGNLTALEDRMVANISAEIAAVRLDVTRGFRQAENNTQTQVTQLQGQINSLNAQLRQLQSLLNVTRAGTTAQINQLQNEIGLFQMPVLNTFGENSAGEGPACLPAQHGQLRRVNGTAAHLNATIVYCNGLRWQRIAPMVGRYSNERLSGSGGGCIMRDIHGFSTTSSSCNSVHMKTNVAQRRNTMITVDFKGYNYGSSTHIDNSVSTYTYHLWGGPGSISLRNYGDGAWVQSPYYSRDGYLTFQLNLRGSYYAGFATSASFLNPTGPNYCGIFDIVATQCNTRY